MNAELKAKWVEALRSGRYQQGAGQLRDSSGCYCCLGLLCALVSGEDANVFVDAADRIDTKEISDAGLWKERESPRAEQTLAFKLALMNDDGKTFAEIADYIEANIPDDPH